MAQTAPAMTSAWPVSPVSSPISSAARTRAAAVSQLSRRRARAAGPAVWQPGPAPGSGMLLVGVDAADVVPLISRRVDEHVKISQNTLKLAQPRKSPVARRREKAGRRHLGLGPGVGAGNQQVAASPR